MRLILLIALMTMLLGCGARVQHSEFGVMPPVAPIIQEPEETTAPDTATATTADEDSDEAADAQSTRRMLDALWAKGDWERVILLMEDKRNAANPPFDAATMTDKLYAAHINAGYAALQNNRADDAMQHFFAALALEPERGETEPGLTAVQTHYVDEAKQLLSQIEQQRQQQAQVEASQ